MWLPKRFLLAVQVLNALAPCQQEQGDMSGADAMLKSSFTLSKNLQDLHSQVGCLMIPNAQPDYSLHTILQSADECNLTPNQKSAVLDHAFQ